MDAYGWLALGVSQVRGSASRLLSTVAASAGVAYDVIAPSLIPSSTRSLAGEGQQRERRDVVTGLVGGAGLGAYLVGPSITDIVADAGLAGGLVAGALSGLPVVLVVWRKFHKSA